MLKSILSVFIKVQKQNSDNFFLTEYCEHKENVLAILKVIESYLYNEKSGIYFFCNEGYTYNLR